MARIFVLDDSPVVLSLAVTGLRAVGHEAAGAADLAGLDALLREATPALILLDVQMPEMFGDDVLEFLRTERGLTCKLLLFSDLDGEQLEARARRVGADGTVPKSKGLDAILSAVATHLGLPQPAGLGAAPSSTLPPPAPPRIVGRRILVVDDSEMTSKLIENELSQKGYEVHTADSVDKATKIILRKQSRPDLVLLDLNMPGVNGEQFCRFLKQNSLFAGIKVVLCSAADPAELKRVCQAAGADGFVPKDAFMSKWVLQQVEPKHP